jgi:hypothetical protein
LKLTPEDAGAISSNRGGTLSFVLQAEPKKVRKSKPPRIFFILVFG